MKLRELYLIETAESEPSATTSATSPLPRRSSASKKNDWRSAVTADLARFVAAWDSFYLRPRTAMDSPEMAPVIRKTMATVVDRLRARIDALETELAEVRAASVDPGGTGG